MFTASSRLQRAVNVLTHGGQAGGNNKSPSSQEAINLSCEDIGDSGLCYLSQFIGKSSVASLSLTDNQISDEGAMALSDALRRNKSIAYLYLNGNFITDRGARKLLLALGDSPALRALNLSGNPLQSETAKNVALMLMEPNCKVSQRISYFHISL